MRVVILEHLQEFAKINLAKLVIWQLAKLYDKLKKKDYLQEFAILNLVK